MRRMVKTARGQWIWKLFELGNALRAAAAFGLILGMLLPAAAEDLRAEAAQYGLVKDRPIGTKPSPGAPSGLSGIVENYSFISRTTEIEACPGTVFGVEHLLSRPLRRGEAPVFLRYEYPQLTLPDGRRFQTHDMSLDPGGNVKIYTGFTFEYAWEMVSGDWTFRLMQGNRELSRTTFKVRVGACLVS
jgi:hypothetical protein